jgi:7,8-dihydroneopterin aldolase/epimerase/oxygenase
MTGKVKIELENMKFYAFHGHFETEQIVGNHFVAQLMLETDDTMASITDRLEDAIDYQKLYAIIKSEMEIPSHLLEHLAGRIIEKIYCEFKAISRVSVKISKVNPPIGGEMQQVSVTMER